MHGPKLNRDWKGLRVKLRRDARNNLAALPAGTAGEIHATTGGGFGFQADACEHCGVAVYIAKLPRDAFTILTPPNDWRDTRGRGRQWRQ